MPDIIDAAFGLGAIIGFIAVVLYILWCLED